MIITTTIIGKGRFVKLLKLVLAAVLLVFFLVPSSQASDGDPLGRLRENTVSFELSNGLPVIIYPRSIAPVFAGHIWVKVGGVDEKPGQTGISHMLEHMAFKGTSRIGTKDIEKERKLLAKHEAVVLSQGSSKGVLELEELAKIEEQLRELWVDNEFTSIYEKFGGVGVNAGTSKDYTVYLINLPSIAFELWCWMESERLLNPVFRQFYREREVVLEERRSRTEDNPGGKIYEVLLASAYLSHPNRLPVIGWRSDIEHLTRSMVEEFHQRYYRPDNMVISLVGDLDPEKAKAMLEKYFGRIPKAKGNLEEVLTPEPTQEGARNIIVEFDAEPQFMMAYHKPIFPHSDDAVFTVIHELMSFNRSSLLYRELVQRRRRALSVYTSEGPGERYPSLFYVGATPAKGVTSKELRDEIQELLERAASEGFSEEDIASAKRRIRIGFFESMSSNYGLSRLLGKTQLLYGDWKELERYYQQVVDVTGEDISRVIKTYLRPGNRTFVELQKKGKEAK